MLSKLLSTESGIVLQYGSRFYNLSTNSPCKAPVSRKYYIPDTREISTKKLLCENKYIKYLLSFNYMVIGPDSKIQEIFLTDLGITVKTYITNNILAPNTIYVQFSGKLPKQALENFINFLSLQ